MKKFYLLMALCAASVAANAADYSVDPMEEPLMVSTEESITKPLGEPVTIEAIMYGGNAPYTVQWISPKNTVMNELTLNAMPDDIMAYEFTPKECGDYVVRIKDAEGCEAADKVRVITTGAAVTASFDSLYLDKESYNNGASADGSDRFASFVSGSFAFNTNNAYGGSYWYGFAYANSTSTKYESLADQYNNVVGGGYNGSENYVVCYVSAWDAAPTITALNSELGTTLTGMYITNSAYAYNSMTVGDAFARAFVKGDWLKVTFTADNGKAVDYYLADLRSDDATKHYILNHWDWVDLSSLGTVKTLTMSMSGSDMGTWGLNTPTYFCMDDFNGVAPASSVHATQSYTAANAAPAQCYGVSGMMYGGMQKGVNIIRMNNGTIRKVLR